MDYVLVSDDCSSCHYIKSAFTLLQLPLKQLTIADLAEHIEIIANAISVIACQNVENEHRKQLHEMIKSGHASLISFQDPSTYNSETDPPLYFLETPFSAYQLKEALGHCFNRKNNIPDLLDYKYPIFEKLVGQSKEITKVKSMIKQVAYTDTTVLILGQSGTGKDVVASCIHYLSDRREKPLVPINFGAIPTELMESELFGHEKGAFTGASTRRSGRFEMAESGTLFLDEIGDMPMPMQVKLLRVIQERKFERVGGSTSIDADVRLIAATNKNLEELIEQHQFREDLFYRLNVFPIYVPSLSERVEDIPVLIDYHLDKMYERLKHRVSFTASATELLCNYPWPGNIRELQNFLERMVILYPDRVVDEPDIDPAYKHKKLSLAHLPHALPADEPFNIKEYIAGVEKQMIKAALERANGIVSLAAEFLSLGRTTLIEKMKKHNLINQN